MSSSRRSSVLVAALLLAGCALGGEERSGWVERADDVCAEHVDDFQAVEPFSGDAVEEIQERDLSDETFAELERWAGEFLVVGRSVERELEALGEPSGTEERRWLSLNSRNGEALERVLAAAAARDEARLYAAFERQGELSEEFIDLSQELGFASCGTVVSD